MNNKDFWIIAGVVVAVIICIVLFVKYAPVWVSLISAGTFLIGIVSGWVSHVMCCRYIKQK